MSLSLSHSPDSIIIGTLPGETCSLSGPSWTPGSSAIQLSSPSFGVMMSSFNQDRSKIDGTGQWHLSKTFLSLFTSLHIHYIPMYAQ